ncbi:MAG: hypothetical protein NC081_01685 [Roseburia sp.]|nr:hypothetical protein [Roseburia sp.]
MWKGSYGKEPFDLRLTLLRMLKRIHWILLYILIGTLLLGGGYYIKNVIFRPERTYCATSTYKIEFASPAWAQYGTYINETTWNTWVHTSEFLGYVQQHLSRQEGGVEMAAEELSQTLSARLASDLRIPSTLVTTNDPQLSECIAAAVEETMVGEFAEGVSDDIAGIRVIDRGVAREVLWDVRPGRAFVLSAVISALFVGGVFLLKEIGDDSIWLPAVLSSRYGIPCLGTVKSPECRANMEYLLRGKRRIALCPVREQINMQEAADALRGIEQPGGEPREWLAFPAPPMSAESCESLRQAEGVVLIVKAGEGAGKPLEYVLEFLNCQEVEITGALLWQADERLIRSYYRLGKKKPEKRAKEV